MPTVDIAHHALKHGVSEKDILFAWNNFVRLRYRGAPHEQEIVLVGCDTAGRFVQLVAARKPNGIIIFHAMRPPTTKVLQELGLIGR